ncbi:Ku protein [Streptomyces sp. NPDC058001]|uniref:non-homologous end joining protein Ku n=1 Tax=Streptomyces sp. NPDC058001 TaxID=3346300 RepID=UPI0036E1589F
MPRPVWSGAITFGLVTIPIKVLPATESHNISFHQYHLTDLARVRVKKVCELDGKALEPEEIGRGYEAPDGGTVEITDDELDAIPLPTAKAIEIEGFVPVDSIDPVRIGEGYYLEGDGQVAAKPYVLLRRALERNAKVAVAKFAWHGRERLGLLRVKDDVLVLHSMKWPDEVRSPEELAPPDIEVDDGEVRAAVALMDSMATDDISDLKDHYREALEKVIEAKAQGKAPPEAPEEEAEEGQVLDLMAALQNSVDQARSARGTRSDGGDATVHQLPRKRGKKAPAEKATAPTKTTTPTKTTATKTAAKKPAAKKTTAKKAAQEKEDPGKAKKATAKRTPARRTGKPA